MLRLRRTKIEFDDLVYLSWDRSCSDVIAASDWDNWVYIFFFLSCWSSQSQNEVGKWWGWMNSSDGDAVNFSLDLRCLTIDCQYADLPIVILAGSFYLNCILRGGCFQWCPTGALARNVERKNSHSSLLQWQDTTLVFILDSDSIIILIHF